MKTSLKKQVIEDLAQLRAILAATLPISWNVNSKAANEIQAHIVRIAETAREVEEVTVVDSASQGERCIVKGCDNHVGQGRFVGSICSPCHSFLTKGDSYHSAAFRLAIDSTFEYMTNRRPN